MPDATVIGRWMFFAGLGLAALGAGVWLAGRFGLPLGRLPGDIRLQNGNFSFYFPLTSSIVVSVVLTIVLNLLARLLRR